MPDLDLSSARPAFQLLTPKQDRVEAALVEALRTHGTRSELRAIVYELVDLFRLQGIPAPAAVATVKSVAARAGGSMRTEGAAVGDSLADRMTLIARWCAARYERGD
jgi:hypothetical protein